MLACYEHRKIHIHLVAQSNGFRDLEVRETLYLGFAHQVLVNVLEGASCFEFVVGLNDILEFLKEPTVDLCELVQAVDAVTRMQCLREEEDTLVGWSGQSVVEVVHMQLFVLGKTVHALTNHTKTLLDGILEGTTDSHHLAYRLHAGADLAIYAAELTEVPTWEFRYDIVQCWLVEGRSIFGN